MGGVEQEGRLLPFYCNGLQGYDPLRRLKQQRLLNNKINKRPSSFEAANVVDKMPSLSTNNNKK